MHLCVYLFYMLIVGLLKRSIMNVILHVLDSFLLDLHYISSISYSYQCIACFKNLSEYWYILTYIIIGFYSIFYYWLLLGLFVSYLQRYFKVYKQDICKYIVSYICRCYMYSKLRGNSSLRYNNNYVCG